MPPCSPAPLELPCAHVSGGNLLIRALRDEYSDIDGPVSCDNLGVSGKANSTVAAFASTHAAHRSGKFPPSAFVLEPNSIVLR